MQQDFLRQSEAARQYLSRIGLGHIRDSINTKTRYKLVLVEGSEGSESGTTVPTVPYSPTVPTVFYPGTYGI